VVRQKIGAKRKFAGALWVVPSVTSPSSAWLRAQNGSTVKSTTHQMMK
jgi:hypothetical protein